MKKLSASIRALPLAIMAIAMPVAAQQIDYDPRRAESLRRCDEPLLHGRQEEASRCYRALSGRPEPLLRAEALWGLGDFQGANEAFRAAVAAAADDPRPRVRWGRLFLATSQYQDAVRLFGEALTIAPRDYEARVANVQLAADRFSGDVSKDLAQLLQDNPDGIEARLVAARVAIENGNLEEARGAAQKALSLAEAQRRAPLEPYTLLAAIEVIGFRDPGRWTRAALNYNPRYGMLFQELGHFEVIRRRYREAEGWFARAVQVQPDLWPAQRERGLNLLRLGDVAGARAALTRAYSGDRFNTATVNTLRLLDSFDRFEVIESANPALRLQLHRSEAAALAPYVGDLARQSIAKFSERYGYTPRDPVTIELYPDHDDFGVRTAGLPGIGLLGVTFGNVVAMDSPSGRKSGEFHWGSTLWHEMAHVFTLSVTANRVPRWLSEGLSMLEEWQTGPTPGVSVGPDLVDAFIGGKLLPVARLDEGFLHPSYPNQVQISYMQAGLVCLFAEQHFGMARVVAFLRVFNEDITTADAVKRAFGVSPEDFDMQFQAFMKQRFAPYIAAPARWKEQMGAANAALEKKDWAAARRAARSAVELLPEFTAGGNAYQMQATAEEGAGDKAAAIATLAAWRKLGGWDPAGLRKLAMLLQEADRAAEATVVLAAVNYVDPLAPAGHGELGELLLATSRPADALREYQVLLALAPLDTAGANFGMARALRAMGDEPGARRHLLQSLEAAPRFRPAQKLLLEMTTEGSP